MRQASLTFSTYNGHQDFKRIARLLSDCGSRYGADSQIHIGNLGWRLAPTDLAGAYGGIGLWSDCDGRIAGFAVMHEPYPADLQIHPDFDQPRDLLHRMMDWLEGRWPSIRTPTMSGESLRVGCLDSNQLQLEVLERRGYSKGNKGYHHLAMDLSSLPAEESLRDGLRLRTISARHDTAAAVALHNLVFDVPQLTPGIYERVIAAPCYRPELNCVVETSGGELVSFALAWIDRESGIVEFEPVGCHPEWRRRGITRILMHEIMRRAIALGATMATVTARVDKNDTIAFYHATGFESRVNEWDYHKVTR